MAVPTTIRTGPRSTDLEQLLDELESHPIWTELRGPLSLVGLPGGVTVTTQPNGNTWSYPDIHGNYTVTTNSTGTRQGTPTTYDPWGEVTASSAFVNNLSGLSDFGADGTSGKLTNTTTNVTIMGARPYNAGDARFLTIDPQEGGCANNYVYAFGDPNNHPDLSGRDTLLDYDKSGGNCGSSEVSLWETDDGHFKITWSFKLYIKTWFGIKVPIPAVYASAAIAWGDDEGDGDAAFKSATPFSSDWSGSIEVGYPDDSNDDGPGYALGNTLEVSIALYAVTPVGSCHSPPYELRG